MPINRIFGKIICAALLTGTLLSSAQAGSLAALRHDRMDAYRTLQEGAHTRAPFAFIRYCVATPQACRGGEARTLDWSSDTRDLVASVNRTVNRSIRPVNDTGSDTWRANVLEGDCDDFAITKRERLMAAGLPASALRMAVATTSSGERHAVLVVSTSAGDFVLDNRTNRVSLWHETDLTFHKIASAQDPRLWRRLA